MLKVTIAGHVHLIPDIWIAGFCRHGATVCDAVAWWHDQAMMAGE